MALQLQVGKTYVTRDGLKLGPMLFDEQSGVFHFYEGDFDAGWGTTGLRTVFIAHRMSTLE